MALINIASFVTQHLRLYYNFFDLYMNITKAYINGRRGVSINLSKWYSKLSHHYFHFCNSLEYAVLNNQAKSIAV